MRIIVLSLAFAVFTALAIGLAVTYDRENWAWWWVGIVTVLMLAIVADIWRDMWRS
jgi:hypothetical protein